ncbi:hypothetical protein L484_014951 [Morus notabilis]|uniref:Uncharacterized protein n=1 Tax=Morus notabilis TaxID=981085 RepID=W9QZ63_9ROSA|nr:hypothetical protein L484_014951 [Morus notabilis]
MKAQIAKGMHSVRSQSSFATHHASIRKQGKEDQENKGKETAQNPNQNKKEVIITVYVESPSPPPRPIHVHQKGSRDNGKKSSKPIFSKTGAYDRRAQLLAYAKELRNADTKQPGWPKNIIPKPKQKISGKSSSTPMRIQGITRNRKRYRRLVPEVDISCRPKSITGMMKKKKKKGNRHSNSPFVVRIIYLFYLFIFLQIPFTFFVMQFWFDSMFVGPFFFRED